MGGLFSSPSIPAPQAPPPAPTPANSQAKIQAAEEQDQINRQAAGRSSTVLTGAQGLGNVGTVSNTSGMLGGS